jgi:ribose transport system substrate-binding protein
MRNLGIRFVILFACVLVMAFALTACGGGSSSSSTTETTSPEAGEATEESIGTSEGSEESTGSGETLVEEPTAVRPTKIDAGLEPLPEPPPKGINVVNLQCDFPTCEAESKTVQAAGKALGWHVKTIVFKTGAPQEAVTQAVNSPAAEFVVLSGIERSIIEPQIKVAEEKGIQIISASNPDPPLPPVWPVAIAQIYGVRQAEALTRWMINDSGGKANIMLLDYQEVPITAAEKPAVEETIEECSECQFFDLPVTGEELAAGSVPAKVVAFLQSHPEVNYVQPAFGNILLGLPQALKSAGLSEQVTLGGSGSMEEAEYKYLANEEVGAYMVAGQSEYSLMRLDAIARILTLQKLPQGVYKKAPQNFLCTPETAKECLGWEGPENQMQEFEELWGLK